MAMGNVFQMKITKGESLFQSKASKTGWISINLKRRQPTRHKPGALFKATSFTTISVIRAFMSDFFLSGVFG